jgi:hypothetical protein
LVGERRGRPEKTTSESSFLSNKEMGISDNQSSRWQKLAAMEEGDFERQVAAPPAALSASLGSPLVRVGFAGCHVPVDPATAWASLSVATFQSRPGAIATKSFN